MKCLKVDEYIRRSASSKEAELLLQDLEKYVKSGPGLQGRTLCDRVIRACNHHLGAGSPDLDHVSQLVKLVELSLQGYDASVSLVPQSSPLYIEKVIFHIVKKLSSLQAHILCSHVAGLLYSRLCPAPCQQAEDYCILVRSCFSVLWSGLSAAKDMKVLTAQDKLHCQMQALAFLLLLNTETCFSKIPVYSDEAITEFESNCESLTTEDASFILQEVHTLLNRGWAVGLGCNENGPTPSLFVLSELVLTVVKVLCVTGHNELVSSFLNIIERKVRDCGDSQCTPLLLGKWAVKLHSVMKAGEESAQSLTECTRALRSCSADLGDQEAHAVLEGCGLVMWAVETTHKNGLSGPVLLSWFSFLEEHQILIKMMSQKTTCQQEGNRLQKTLCVNLYQGFVFTYESMLSSELEDGGTLDRVLLYCQATAGQLISELRKLPKENLLIKAVTTVSNLACGLYNQRRYDQAFTLVEIVCKDLCKSCPLSLSVDRVNRLFMLAVQTSRRAQQLERALDWVILWLKTLGEKICTHMAEPVSLWVKTKIDAARNSEEDIRLRTLRDGFGPDVPDEGVMLGLLEEELRAYKEVAGDTAQERYNTLCDLLDICHEESSHTHLRAVYLCEMAQVVCFQDFSEQTDCTAVDFTLESLRLLEEEPETPENADKLKDDKAHTLLWLYICTLEKNLQEATEKDAKQRELREQTTSVANPIGTNDFDYEDKQKTQDSILVYDGLQFNLAAENKLRKPLDRALDEWSSLLNCPALPSIRNPKQTCTSIALTASLFRLMGKPLKALEAYQLAIGLSHRLADAHGCANVLCQSASLLLEVGSPDLALTQLEQAEKNLSTDTTVDGPSSLSMLTILLKAQYYYSTGQVDRGVPYLCEVLKEVNVQRQSKSWYLLRARALQTCCSYLSLDTAAMPQTQRSCITQLGMNSPDTVLYESLKLLYGLLVTLVGKGLYGTNDSSSDVHFVDQGDNLVLKWQLLSELLNCSMKVVALRSCCGAINDARHQCLEALKLAIKLQALSRCAELLVIKAELELKQGETEQSEFDLDQVRNLLELCIDVSDQVQKTGVKIKPRKGRLLQKTQCPLPTTEEDFKSILSTRWTGKEPVVIDLANSPPLKAKPLRWLSSLTHEFNCQCSCCSEPCLGHATARWAATQADVLLHLNPNEAKVGFKLRWAALTRCKNVAAKFGAKLTKLFPSRGPAKDTSKPSLMQDVVGRVYLSTALSSLEPRLSKVCSIWKILEAGLSAVDSTVSPALKPVKAGLNATKAIALWITLASKKGCNPQELFSNAWTWNEPDEEKLKNVHSSSKPKDSTKANDVCDRTKGKVVKSRNRVTSVSTKGKADKDLGMFDFNTAVPMLSCTPVRKMKPVVQKAPRVAPKLSLQVYEEHSPVIPVPAAPKRTKKSRFPVEFSDESDSEVNNQARPKEKSNGTEKRPTTRRNTKTAPDPPVEKVPLKRQVRGKKCNAVSRATSSEDDDTAICRPARRGRSRREPSTADAETDEPEKMRAIEEEMNTFLDVSIEQLRTSDNETQDHPSSSKDIDFEILRRDICGGMERCDLSEIRSRDLLGASQQTHLPQSNTRPDDASLEDIQTLLRSAWLSFQHFPSPTLYPTLCSLLALTIGQQDPVTTAMLHAQSLGITSRHRTIRHLASSRKKLRKSLGELADKMDAMSLNEPSSDGKTSTEMTLSQVEDIFFFPTADSSSFPENHCKEFLQQLDQLPSGVAVCVISLLGVKPGEMGNGIMLSRLEKGCAPVTVHIPTSKYQQPISCLVQEMDSIQVQQKLVSCVSEKAKWWEGRRALDSRVERLLKEMETSLGCWKSFLLPLSSDPELLKQTEHLRKTLSARGVTVGEEMLKAVLSASPELSQEDLQRFTLGLSPQWDLECDQLMHTAVSHLAERDEPKGHMVLILDKYLQKLPWECISILKSHSVSRMPSLHSLIALSIQKEADSRSILKQGVDARQAFYVLDPDANLGNTRNQFKEWFSNQPNWEGVCGVVPDSGQLEEAVATKDLYIYVGHGAGARFLNSQAVLKQQMRAASLIFGCSSAALAVRGDQEGQGIILNYLIGGCPFFLGNLWDVTDLDIDRFTKALLESWLSAGSGAPILDFMGPSRQATQLKYLIGAAPVAYGLPVHLH